MRRDLFGERPFYFVERDGAVRAASSLGALLARAGVPGELDRAAAVAALCGRLAPDRSLLAGVRRLPPGHELRAGEGAVEVVPYWQPPQPSGDAGADAAALRDELLRRLRSAVARGTGDGAAACSLSGGMDSAGVLALMVERNGAPAVRAYTLASDFDEGEEAAGARRLAARMGVRHCEIRVREEDLAEHLPETVRACEDLVWNGRAVASHLFFRGLRAAGERAVLGGVGADEILCGHPAGLRSFAVHRDALARLALPLLTPEAAALLPPSAPVDPVPPGAPPWIAWQLEFLRTVLPDSTLPPECRTSAAEGVDVRLPYLDPEVADFCLRLPPDLRVRGELGKVLLREAYRDRLPDELLARAKAPRLAPAGGGSPAAQKAWRELYDRWTKERLDPLGLFEVARVRRLAGETARLDAPDPGRAAADAVLLRIVSLAVLAEAFDRPGSGARSERPAAPSGAPRRAV